MSATIDAEAIKQFFASGDIVNTAAAPLTIYAANDPEAAPVASLPGAARGLALMVDTVPGVATALHGLPAKTAPVYRHALVTQAMQDAGFLARHNKAGQVWACTTMTIEAVARAGFKVELADADGKPTGQMVDVAATLIVADSGAGAVRRAGQIIGTTGVLVYTA